MPTIIYPPSIRWNWMFQRPQQILGQLAAQGYTVLYEDVGKFPEPVVRQLSPTFYLCQGIPALKIPHKRPRILWLTVPSHIEIIEEYDPDLVVFDAVDEPKEEFSVWAPFYPKIIQRSNLIFASARTIYDHLSALHPNVHLVPNGDDFTHFSSSKAPRPNDLPAEGPLIGYSGAIAPWVDWDLLKQVIEANQNLQFIFIGVPFHPQKFPLRGSNVKHLGLKPYAQLPAYFQSFSVALIPFRLSEMTKGCNPIKLYEYYAAGLPVLATPLPELSPVPKIYLESDPKRFSLRLRQLSQDRDPWKAERQAFAQANDWVIRANQMRECLIESLPVGFQHM